MSVPCKLTSPVSTDAELVFFDGKQFRLRAAHPFAPGQPLTLQVLFARSHLLELKSTGSVKRPEGDFEIRARAQTLPKPTRDALAAHFIDRSG